MNSFSTNSNALDEWLTDEAFESYCRCKPDPEMEDRLSGLTVKNLFANQAIRNRDLAKACLSGIWLLYQFLDESHEISQQLRTPEGSYWHGIMHRMEGDHSNAKYWFRNTGPHPTDLKMCEAVTLALSQFSEGSSQEKQDPRWKELCSLWDHGLFVDLLVDYPPIEFGFSHGLAVQQWKELFQFCYRGACQ